MDQANPFPGSREELMLREVMEMSISAQRHVHDRLMEAEEAGDICRLNQALTRAQRSFRQTVALKAKLVRDFARDARETAPLREKERDAETARRVARLYKAVERVTWDEYDAEDEEECETAEAILEEFDEWLEEEKLSEDFLAEPFDLQLSRFRSKLGLRGPAEEENLDDPTAPVHGGGGPSAPRVRPQAGPRTGSEPMVEGASPPHDLDDGDPSADRQDTS